jgi:transcriptional regulator with XRE-family HTH domain
LEEPVNTKNAHQMDAVIGKRIMMLRQVVGLTQDELARRCGLTFEELIGYEKCSARIPASVLYLIAQELDSDIAYFFEGPDYAPRPRPRPPIAVRRPAE